LSEPAAAAARHLPLCRLDEIADGGTRAFTVPGPRLDRDIFVLRVGAGAHAFENRCPHTGVPLDWMPGQFLTEEEDFFICATHGALFRLTDGHCVQGPCAGKALTPIAIHVTDGQVILTE
jgi:nitrite reductase/ring-hydroxylating ferredoxin subunit